jgi:hypothetical protein
MSEYTIGACVICNKQGALKDGKCKDCQSDISDILSKMFGGKDEIYRG